MSDAMLGNQSPIYQSLVVCQLEVIVVVDASSDDAAILVLLLLVRQQALFDPKRVAQTEEVWLRLQCDDRCASDETVVVAAVGATGGAAAAAGAAGHTNDDVQCAANPIHCASMRDCVSSCQMQHSQQV